MLVCLEQRDGYHEEEVRWCLVSGVWSDDWRAWYDIMFFSLSLCQTLRPSKRSCWPTSSDDQWLPLFALEQRPSMNV